ncbi:pyridoxal-phosphate dependent enzyme [Ruegeria sp. HKCCD7255]|uniref:pyridoxal-phosphate dependent enzyme n=1 Tax=Ruegeria sp. HKCCD7255 TaxID=2683004 RepID=UPI00148A1137|nr:pyridoxal-phosphate dependent enzyme [Ruegeria sp. HKCCD7255]
MQDPMTFDVAKPLALLQSCPAYTASPLVKHKLEGRSILIKDETHRMNLGAFKALGGVYAVAELIRARVEGPLDPDEFLDKRVQSVAAQLTFVCASAGNHGMAVAAGAQLFGASARIHLASTVPDSFAKRLRAKGAEVIRSGQDYEASVAAAIDDANTSGAIHLADGSWPGYTQAPHLVMEGYTVIAEEMCVTFEASGNWPSDVYLQAGVGGLAAAMAYMIRSTWAVQPKIIVVEPDAAPCLRDSVQTGRMVTVKGPTSVMGRLDCKTPSMLAFDILRDRADTWVTVSDDQARDAVDQAKTLGLATTPSGAAGLAACLAEKADRPLVILSEGNLADG